MKMVVYKREIRHKDFEPKLDFGQVEKIMNERLKDGKWHTFETDGKKLWDDGVLVFPVKVEAEKE